MDSANNREITEFKEDSNKKIRVENVKLSFTDKEINEVNYNMEQEYMNVENPDPSVSEIYPKTRPPLIINTNLVNILAKKSIIETIEDSFKTRAKKAIMDPIPKKPLLLSLFLMIIGFILVILGIVLDIEYKDPTRGIALWVIGTLCSIPGFYYSYKFYQAIKASTPEERRNALSDVPNE